MRVTAVLFLAIALGGCSTSSPCRCAGVLPEFRAVGEPVIAASMQASGVDEVPAAWVRAFDREAAYPEMARRASVSGEVVAAVRVGPGGTADSVRVAEAPNRLLSDDVERSLRAMRFAPAPADTLWVRVRASYLLAYPDGFLRR